MADANKSVSKVKSKETKDGTIKEDNKVETQASNESKEVKKSAPKDKSTKAVKAEKPAAKAGKRSEKALKEAEELAAKAERKATQSDETSVKSESKPKPVSKTRTRLERRSKNYRKAAEQIDKNKTYDLAEAIGLAIKTSSVKFDASVELHFRLGVDPKQADQNIRGVVSLPAGTGKTQRVAVFADDADADKAKKAGADIVGIDTITKALDKGQIDFDILIATPANMPKLGKYAKVLGPKGLMPNPKSGTVSANTEKAVTEAKAGRVEFRVDSTGIVHLAIGKVSFGQTKLMQNCDAIITAIKHAKPASIKNIYVQSVFVTTSMGPSIKTTI